MEPVGALCLLKSFKDRPLGVEVGRYKVYIVAGPATSLVLLDLFFFLPGLV